MSWYSLCKKYTLLRWIDDNIVWYVYVKPKNLFCVVRNWFYCNWNKEHLKLVKDAVTSYPWDFYFMYRLIEDQIDKQIKYFEVNNDVENTDTQILRPLRIAKYCLRILNNEEILTEFENNVRTYVGPKVNYTNAKRYIDVSEFNSNYCALPSYDEIFEFYKKYPEEYYQLKCRNILFMILRDYSMKWWY